MTTHHRLTRGAIVAAAVSMTLASAAPALAGDLSMSKSDTVVAQVVWDTGDPEAAHQTWGILAAHRQGSATGISYQDVDMAVSPCDNGTPEPDDDFEAVAGTARTGEGMASSASIAKNLRGATVSGVMTIYTVAFDECAGTWDVLAVDEDVAVAVDLVAVGRGERWVSVYRESVPGEYTMRELSRMRGYRAAGTATVGGIAIDFEDALIARFSSISQWRS